MYASFLQSTDAPPKLRLINPSFRAVLAVSNVPDSHILLSGWSRIVEARDRAGAGYSARYPAG